MSAWRKEISIHVLNRSLAPVSFSEPPLDILPIISARLFGFLNILFPGGAYGWQVSPALALLASLFKILHRILCYVCLA